METNREKFELELSPITIGGITIEFYSVKRWNIIEENPYSTEEEYIKNFPLWVKLWEASIVLSDHMAKLKIDPGAEILELGAGMGLTGLMLGKMGYNVTLTDSNDDALEMLKKNIDHNNLENVVIKKLDWNSPDLTEKYNIIYGSELVYKESASDLIIHLLKTYLASHGKIYIAHDIKRMNMVKFIDKASKDFDIKNSIKTLRGGDEPFRISLLSLTQKNG